MIQIEIVQVETYNTTSNFVIGQLKDNVNSQLKAMHDHGYNVIKVDTIIDRHPIAIITYEIPSKIDLNMFKELEEKHR